MHGRSLALALCLSVGCGFKLTPSGGGDDAPEGRRVVITDDTEAQLADNGGIDDAVVTAWGTLEPDAFVVGGLVARAFDADNYVTPSRTYEEVVAAAGAPAGFAYRQFPEDFNTLSPNRPRGLGLTSDDNYTLLYTGEVLLPQGAVTLIGDADDNLLVQVALDGVAWSAPLSSQRAERTAELLVPEAGWYPIRAAYGQDGGSSRWKLQYTQLGGSRVDLDRTRLRARVTAGGGLIASAFEHKAMLTPRGETAVETIDEDYGGGAPSHDLAITVTDQYAVRFAGQVRIDTAGSYTFTADIGTEPADLFRIWIDGVLVANAWPPTVPQPSATLDLAVGWHDLLVDFGEETQTARIEVRMSGPGIADGVIDPQRLRPAVAIGHTAPYVQFTSFPINDATDAGPGVTIVPLPLQAPTGATIASVDYGLALENQRLSDLTIELLDCSGARAIPPITTPASYDYFAADTSCAGSPVVPAAPWAWRLTDTVIGGTSGPVLRNPTLIATYTGGDRVPFAPAYTFVSSPKRTTGAIGFGPIDVAADLRGRTLMIEVRAGADPAALTAAAWVPVANGAVPALAASEWAQYRLAISGDGWKLASVDKVDLTYVVQDE